MGDRRRLRRNATPCVLCGDNKTYDWDHICDQCRREWRRGHAFAEAEEKVNAMPKGMIEAPIAMYWYLYHFAGTRGDKHDLANTISESLLELVGATRVPYLRWGTSHSWAVGYPRDYKQGITQARYALVGNQHTLDLLQQIYETICHLMAGAYHEGFRDGKGFIAQIADGKMSAKDLERL